MDEVVDEAHRPLRGVLHLGDNLTVLRERVDTGSVDLVYLDPPFNSQRGYEVVFRARDPEEARERRPAFDDAWRWDAEAEAAYGELTSRRGDHPEPLRALVVSLRSFLGPSDMLAYVVMMAPRLVELRRVLRQSGSIYLHCDPTASHYLKLSMDAVFGARSFRNEVIWRYRRWPARSRQFQKMHDVLLFYSKSHEGEHSFEVLYGYEKLAPSTLKTFGTRRQVADFSSGRRKPSTVDVETRGPPLSDVWEVGVIAASGKERVGYPTQKPEALIERVVRASSREGDVVLDPFCGSGTTAVVAERLGRRFIGIDATPLALELASRRLDAAFPDRGRFYEVRPGPEPSSEPEPARRSRSSSAER